MHFCALSFQKRIRIDHRILKSNKVHFVIGFCYKFSHSLKIFILKLILCDIEIF